MTGRGSACDLSPRQADHAWYADRGGGDGDRVGRGHRGLRLIPQLSFTYPWQAENLALETAASLIALLACFLVFGRLRRRTRLNELMLAWALAVFSLSNLMLVTVPIVAGWAPDDLTVWAAPTARSLGALLFVLAAFVPTAHCGGPGWCLP